MLATGGEDTVTVMLVVSEHPAALMATTVYDVVDEGVTLMDAEVAPVFHE